jgi:hypothetical protein
MKIEGRTINLAADSKFTIKSVSSGKEIAFVGPGSAIVCRGGDEDEHWLLGGTVESGAGGGLGAETWVVVPGFAVLRFSGASVHAEVGTQLALSVQNGSIFVLPIGAPPPADAGLASDPAGFFRLDGGRAITLPKATGSAKNAVDKCVAPDAAVGDLAAKHVDARKKARALCTVALASPALDPKDRVRAEAADTSWRVVLTP